MKKTVRRWMLIGLITYPIATLLWWNAPRVINSDFWLLGFAMEGLSALSLPVLPFCIYSRWNYAQRVRSIVAYRAHIDYPTIEYLDVPRLSESRLRELVDTCVNDDLDLFGDVIKFLESSKNE